MICTKFLLRASYNLGLQDYAIEFTGPIKIIFILNFPFYYLYFKSIIDDNTIFNKRYLVHLITPVIFIIYVFIAFAVRFEIVIYFKIINFIFLITLSLFYSFKSYNLLKNKLWSIPEKEQSTHQKLMKKWTILIYVLSLFMLTRFILSLSFEFYSKQSLTGDDFMVFNSIIWMIIFLKIIISPEILFGIPKLSKKINMPVDSGIEIPPIWKINNEPIINPKDQKLKEKIDINVLNIIKEIEFLGVKQHYFRNQKITISDLSNEMNIPLSHLVYIFKYHCQYTFTEYKTQIKINDAKALIEDGFLTSNTLESLAIEVGFSSYNPFFTSFKKLVGMSPNEYSLRMASKATYSK
jgi:AraC-like DNA-binding protein